MALLDACNNYVPTGGFKAAVVHSQLSYVDVGAKILHVEDEVRQAWSECVGGAQMRLNADCVNRHVAA
ncbi:hypothetical protein GA0061100_11863 [Rhizobium hainanense]|uniref:Uncharacterized protein n=1 Tax=Rhizobium hainanense TaxID=52131 RepID=A0A1C3WGE7_9HYPH|nr:hypothetical protein GA0061100_11863 [Rhizobium hainanense]